MPVATNICRRGGIYHFRCRVPASLVVRVGRRELSRSLKTAEPGAARRRAAVLSGRLYLLWAAIRMTLDPAEVEKLVRDWLQQALDQDQVQRANPEFAVDFARHTHQTVDQAAAYLIGTDAEDSMGVWRERLRSQDWSAANSAVNALLKLHNLEIPQESPSYRLLAARMTQAIAELHATRIERSSGNPAYNPLSPSGAFPGREFSTGTRLAPATIPAPTIGPKLSDICANYLAEMQRLDELKLKRVQKIRASLDILVGFFGADFPISGLSTKDIGEFKSALTRLPPNHTKRFVGKSLRDILADDALLKAQPPMAVGTINGHLAVVSGLLAWAMRDGLIRENPAADVRVVGGRAKAAKARRGTFLAEHLKQIFNSPVYTGCKSPRYAFEPGSHYLSDWRYWIPLMCLFTGARLGELCDLEPRDVRLVDEVWCLDIRPDPKKKRTLKTRSSQRLVPLHKELIRLGIPKMAQHRLKEDSRFLLEGLPAAVAGYSSHYPGKWGRAFLDHCLGAERCKAENLVFHGFRHTMEDALREAGIEDRLADQILGHATNHVSAGYGKGYKPPQLLGAISKLNFPVNLSHLKPFGTGTD